MCEVIVRGSRPERPLPNDHAMNASRGEAKAMEAGRRLAAMFKPGWTNAWSIGASIRNGTVQWRSLGTLGDAAKGLHQGTLENHPMISLGLGLEGPRGDTALYESVAPRQGSSCSASAWARAATSAKRQASAEPQDSRAGARSASRRAAQSGRAPLYPAAQHAGRCSLARRRPSSSARWARRGSVRRSSPLKWAQAGKAVTSVTSTSGRSWRAAGLGSRCSSARHRTTSSSTG